MNFLSIVLFFAGLGFGYVLFLIILKILPTRLQSTNKSQKQEIIAEARRQMEHIRREAVETEATKIQLLREELEDQIKIRGEDLNLEEEALVLREQSATNQENRMKKIEKDFNDINSRLGMQKRRREDLDKEIAKLHGDYVSKLSDIAKIDSAAHVESAKIQLAETRQLELQKATRLQLDELQGSVRRIANRFMSRSLNRYAPDFYWPKMINQVDLNEHQRWIEFLASDQHQLFPMIKELVEVDAELFKTDNMPFPVLKLSGGMGAYREAARLTMAELVKQDPKNWERFPAVFQKHKTQISLHASKLGKFALNELKLREGIHPEVQQLVGFLNWRTSYRQNQFLHSLEVAKLAGVVATEVGVDPSDAKRCGLLHDIGKVIDYRIEGSHAVISGDYADRFGEKRYICDALMSHHNDLIVETPLAYVLKTADTLSGARPGARVNLEEGYQIRLGAIDDVVRSFPGITKSIIMNGGREVHIEVNNKRIKDEELQELTTAIAKKIESDVAFPGQIKVMVTRRFESSAVA